MFETKKENGREFLKIPAKLDPVCHQGAIAKFFVAKIFAITFVSIKLILYLCPKLVEYGESISIWSTC